MHHESQEHLEAHYQKNLEVLNDLKKQASEKQVAFLQQLLLVSASLLGILISLHSNSSPYLHIRAIFLAAVLLLLLGVLLTAITLFDYAMLTKRLSQGFRNELENALKENREIYPVFVKPRKRTAVCEKTAYTFLLLALLVLSCYSVLIMFNQ